jgi:protein-S-isoprenylcysteine O-methyltransferase Ste14
MLWWFVRALFQAVVVHFSCTNDNIAEVDGAAIVVDALILNVLITTTFDTQHFTSVNIIFIWENWLLYLLLTIAANLLPASQ